MVAALDGADLAFVAAPVGKLEETVRAALAAAGPDCVVTDVGSTKRAIVAAHDDPASSAAIRWRAPRPRASSTPAPTSSTARPGT